MCLSTTAAQIAVTGVALVLREHSGEATGPRLGSIPG